MHDRSNLPDTSRAAFEAAYKVLEARKCVVEYFHNASRAICPATALAIAGQGGDLDVMWGDSRFVDLWWTERAGYPFYSGVLDGIDGNPCEPLALEFSEGGIEEAHYAIGYEAGEQAAYALKLRVKPAPRRKAPKETELQETA